MVFRSDVIFAAILLVSTTSAFESHHWSFAVSGNYKGLTFGKTLSLFWDDVYWSDRHPAFLRVVGSWRHSLSSFSPSTLNEEEDDKLMHPDAYEHTPYNARVRSVDFTNEGCDAEYADYTVVRVFCGDSIDVRFTGDFRSARELYKLLRHRLELIRAQEEIGEACSERDSNSLKTIYREISQSVEENNLQCRVIGRRGSTYEVEKYSCTSSDNEPKFAHCCHQDCHCAAEETALQCPNLARQPRHRLHTSCAIPKLHKSSVFDHRSSTAPEQIDIWREVGAQETFAYGKHRWVSIAGVYGAVDDEKLGELAGDAHVVRKVLANLGQCIKLYVEDEQKGPLDLLIHRLGCDEYQTRLQQLQCVATVKAVTGCGQGEFEIEMDDLSGVHERKDPNVDVPGELILSNPEVSQMTQCLRDVTGCEPFAEVALGLVEAERCISNELNLLANQGRRVSAIMAKMVHPVVDDILLKTTWKSVHAHSVNQWKKETKSEIIKLLKTAAVKFQNLEESAQDVVTKCLSGAGTKGVFRCMRTTHGAVGVSGNGIGDETEHISNIATSKDVKRQQVLTCGAINPTCGRLAVEHLLHFVDVRYPKDHLRDQGYQWLDRPSTVTYNKCLKTSTSNCYMWAACFGRAMNHVCSEFPDHCCPNQKVATACKSGPDATKCDVCTSTTSLFFNLPF